MTTETSFATVTFDRESATVFYNDAERGQTLGLVHLRKEDDGRWSLHSEDFRYVLGFFSDDRLTKKDAVRVAKAALRISGGREDAMAYAFGQGRIQALGFEF